MRREVSEIRFRSKQGSRAINAIHVCRFWRLPNGSTQYVGSALDHLPRQPLLFKVHCRLAIAKRVSHPIDSRWA